MKLEDLPNFAKPYKKPGYDVRKSGDSYRLIKITSERVEGKKYPVLKQLYIGTILEDGTLKKSHPHSPSPGFSQEFGLSDFLLKRFKRTLQRSVYGYEGEKATELIKLAILYYVLGTVSDIAIKRCRLTCANAEKLSKLATEQRVRIERLSQKIAAKQSELFREDKADFEMLMRLCVVDSLAEKNPEYPEEATAILQRHGEKL